ncbi:MAG: hypothetical protein ACPGES_04355 [Coraliomargarita sp.]
MAFSASGDLKKSKQRLKAAMRNYNSAATAEIAPSEENLDASLQNLDALQRQFSVVSGELRKGTRLTSTDDGIAVTTGIRDYIRKFQRNAASPVDSNGELLETPIGIPDDFAFGFSDYYPTTEIPDDPQEVIYLGKQRQILGYMMTKLMAALPKSIESIERERYTKASSAGAPMNQGFVINPAISAAVPGAIDTMAFELKFTGSTDCLRQFFNNLNTFDLPIVVRSVEVSRDSGEGISVEPEKGGLEDIFGAFGGSSPTETPPSQASREPVIKGNNSQFTLIVEYFEVVHSEANTTLSVEEQS